MSLFLNSDLECPFIKELRTKVQRALTPSNDRNAYLETRELLNQNYEE
jgi:hypothetical protein